MKDIEDILKLTVLVLIILCALRLLNLWSTSLDVKPVDKGTGFIPSTPQKMMPDCGRRHRTLVIERGEQLIYLCEK
jgi:hypothetical protein